MRPFQEDDHCTLWSSNSVDDSAVFSYPGDVNGADLWAGARKEKFGTTLHCTPCESPLGVVGSKGNSTSNKLSPAKHRYSSSSSKHSSPGNMDSSVGNRGDSSAGNRRDNSAGNRLDNSALYSGDNSAGNRWDNSALYRGDNSAINKGDNSALYSGDNSAINKGDNSALYSGDNSAGNRWDNSALYRRDNSAGNRGDNLAGNRGDNSAGNRRDNSAGNRRDNSAGNRRDNSAGNRRDNSAGNRRDNSALYRGDNSAGNKGDNSALYRRDNSSLYRGDNSAGNKGDNSALNRGDNSAGNRGDNSAGNRRDNSAGNRRDNSAGNRRDNSAGNRRDNSASDWDNSVYDGDNSACNRDSSASNRDCSANNKGSSSSIFQQSAISIRCSAMQHMNVPEPLHFAQSNDPMSISYKERGHNSHFTLCDSPIAEARDQNSFHKVLRQPYAHIKHSAKMHLGGSEPLQFPHSNDSLSNEGREVDKPHYTRFESPLMEDGDLNSSPSSVFEQSCVQDIDSTKLPGINSELLQFNKSNPSFSLSRAEIIDSEAIRKENTLSTNVNQHQLQQLNAKESSEDSNYDLANTTVNFTETYENFRKSHTCKEPGVMSLTSSSEGSNYDNGTDAVSNRREIDKSISPCDGSQIVECGLEADCHSPDGLNTNNHKIPCTTTIKQKLDQDLLRITEENFCLTSQNYMLRQSIRNVRHSTMGECSKVLDSIINYCECKSNSRPRGTRAPQVSSCIDSERVGSGCSTGGCGGYTPSGWNKLLTLHCLQCEDPCCPYCCSQCPDPCPHPDTCTCCPDPCTYCPDPCSYCPPKRLVVKKCMRKKHTCANMTCNSRLTDENSSATKSRPCTKILGELAFQLERRILDYVFGMEGYKRRRFYGYTVNNISQMMDKECKNAKGEDDSNLRAEIDARLRKLASQLRYAGYNIKVHGDFAQQIINRYGLLACPPDPDTIDEFGLQNARCISKLITQLARGEHEANNLQILLKGLKHMSKFDGGPLFVW